MSIRTKVLMIWVLPLTIFFGGNAIAAWAITEFIPPTVHESVNPNPVSVPIGNVQGIGTRTLSPCPTEDSDNCYWIAETMGNGPERIARGQNPGTSFVTIDGVTYYFDN